MKMKTVERILTIACASALNGSVLAADVRLVTADAAGESSYTNGAHWSDAAIPSSGSSYLVNLGEGSYLRSPESYVIGDVAWPGGKLTLGDADNVGRLRLPIAWTTNTKQTKGFAYATIADLVVVNGGVELPGSTATYEQYLGLYGALTARSSGEVLVDLPCLSSKGRVFYFGSNITGDKDQVIRVKATSSGTTGSVAWLYLGGDNRGYKGKWIFDNVSLFDSYDRSSYPDYRFGDDPGEYLEDGLYFPKGLYVSTHSNKGSDGNQSQNIPFKNRGIKFENGGYVATRNCGLTFSCPVKGTGTLKVKSTEGTNYAYFMPVTFTLGLDCPNVTLDGNAYSCIRFGETVTDESQCLITAPANTFVGASGNCTVKVAMTQGAGFYAAPTSDKTGLGHLTVAKGSTLPATIRVLCKGLPSMASDLTLPVLSIPTTLRETLTSADVQVHSPSTGTDVAYPWFVKTENGYHTVYVSAIPTHVVPAGTPGNTPTAPYDTWATAANDIQTAIDATSSGFVVVGTGTYDIRSTIVLEKAMTLMGVKLNSATYETDATGVKLDGGYPTYTNRLMKLKKAAVRSLVFQNAATTSAGSYNTTWAPGGAGINFGDSEAVVRDCTFSNCLATANGGAVGAFAVIGQRMFNCKFLYNYAKYSGGAGAFQYNSEYGHNFGFVDCYFEGNRAGSEGGAVYSNARGIELTRCTFKGNWANNYGAVGHTPGNITDCVFDGNGCDAAEGTLIGAFHHATSSGTYSGSASVKRCVFRNSGSGVNGKRLLNVGYGITLEDCVISNNSCSILFINSTSFSGKVNNAEGRVWTDIRQLLVTGNYINTYMVWGALTNNRWMNCTFAGNTLRAGGSVPYLVCVNEDNYFTNLVINSVFHDGSTWQLTNFGMNGSTRKNPNQLTVSNSCFDVSINNPADADNIDGKNRNVGLTKGYQLRRGSILREKGMKLDWMDSVTDVCGQTRIVGRQGQPLSVDAKALPDIGCFECQEPVRGLYMLVK